MHTIHALQLPLTKFTPAAGLLMLYAFACVRVQVDTSGDTGPAAIAAVRGCDNLDITVLYPYQRVSALVTSY